MGRSLCLAAIAIWVDSWSASARLAQFSARWNNAQVTTCAIGQKGDVMAISNEGLIIILLVGLIAGWLAGQLVHGTGFGLIGDLIIGVIGAFIGAWLLPQLGIRIGAGVVNAIASATIGAVVLLLILRVVRSSARW